MRKQHCCGQCAPKKTDLLVTIAAAGSLWPNKCLDPAVTIVISSASLGNVPRVSWQRALCELGQAMPHGETVPICSESDLHAFLFLIQSPV